MLTASGDVSRNVDRIDDSLWFNNGKATRCDIKLIVMVRLITFGSGRIERSDEKIGVYEYILYKLRRFDVITWRVIVNVTVGYYHICHQDRGHIRYLVMHKMGAT